MFEWDEKKRESNLVKHGFDFEDASLVYFHPEKLTIRSTRQEEIRYKDLAFVEMLGSVLALVYTHRGQYVRIISFRRASRSERTFYDKQNGLGAGTP